MKTWIGFLPYIKVIYLRRSMIVLIQYEIFYQRPIKIESQYFIDRSKISLTF